MAAMAVDLANPLVADLWLRGASAPVRARLSPHVPSLGPLVVARGGARSASGAVTLALPAGLELEDAHAALCWAADHARELGVRSGVLVLAAAGDELALGWRLAARAAADGWPDNARLVVERGG